MNVYLSPVMVKVDINLYGDKWWLKLNDCGGDELQ